MSQSGFIAAMLLAAFILWLAINDRLTAYTAVLFGPTQQPTPQGNLFIPGSSGGVEGPTEDQPGNASGGGGGILSSIFGGKPLDGGGGSLGDFLDSLDLSPSATSSATSSIGLEALAG